MYAVDVAKVSEYKKLVVAGASGDVRDIIGSEGTKKANKSAQEKYIKIIQSLDKNIQTLMTKEGYESFAANRLNTLSAKVCDKGNYTLQVTDFILEKNLYSAKEDKAGYYYEAKLKFISTDGKNERKDIAKGYIGLLKENGQWKVSIYRSETYPKLYKEILINEL